MASDRRNIQGGLGIHFSPAGVISVARGGIWVGIRGGDFRSGWVHAPGVGRD